MFEVDQRAEVDSPSIRDIPFGEEPTTGGLAISGLEKKIFYHNSKVSTQVGSILRRIWHTSVE